jgi:hypothetical protein
MNNQGTTTADGSPSSNSVFIALAVQIVAPLADWRREVKVDGKRGRDKGQPGRLLNAQNKEFLNIRRHLSRNLTGGGRKERSPASSTVKKQPCSRAVSGHRERHKMQLHTLRIVTLLLEGFCNNYVLDCLIIDRFDTVSPLVRIGDKISGTTPLHNCNRVDLCHNQRTSA